MKFLMLIIVFSFYSACGKKPEKMREATEGFLPEPEGSFSATLLPINWQATPNFKGLVTVTKYGDHFHVKVKYRNGSKGPHRQGLYSASFCGADVAYDFGTLLIPFDGDLSGEALGREGFPSGASFDYEQSTSYNLMLANSKLQNDGLQLEGRIVMIRSDDVPAACGVLSRANVGSIDIEPDGPVIVRPRHPRRPTVHPVPVQPVERPRTRWQRWRERLAHWWRSIWNRET